jgi:hypothetical protein
LNRKIHKLENRKKEDLTIKSVARDLSNSVCFEREGWCLKQNDGKQNPVLMPNITPNDPYPTLSRYKELFPQYACQLTSSQVLIYKPEMWYSFPLIVFA